MAKLAEAAKAFDQFKASLDPCRSLQKLRKSCVYWLMASNFLHLRRVLWRGKTWDWLSVC